MGNIHNDNIRYYKTLLAILLIISVTFLATLSTQRVAALSPILNLSESDSTSVLPQIAIAPDGSVLVVWRDAFEGHLNDIVYSKSTDGIELSAPDTISNSPFPSTMPQVAVSADNTFFVTWQQFVAGKSQEVFVGSSADNFANKIEVSNNTGASTSPQIAVSGSDAYVVWIDATYAPNDILLANSTDNYANVMNVSNSLDVGSTYTPGIAVSPSGTVYIVWEEATTIMLANSTDSYADKVTISNPGQSASSPRIAVSSSGTVYIVWQENSDIYFASSSDNFATKVPVSGTADPSANARIAVSSSGTVYIVWQENSDIYFASSSDNFATKTNVSDRIGSSSSPQLAVGAASGSNNVYIVWEDTYLDPDNNVDPNSEILFAASGNNGSSFDCPVNLSGTPGRSTSQHVATWLNDTNDSVYVVWEDHSEDLGGGTGDILLQPHFDALSTPIVTIDTVNNTSPKWNGGIEISGSVSRVDDGDTVTIDWGDGNTTTDVPISDCSWGPIPHNYTSSAMSTNPNQLAAKIVSSTSIEKASSIATEINVQKHSTLLTLDPIAAVNLNADVRATGVIVDADTGFAIQGASISFTGNGAEGIFNPTLTNATGSFSSSSQAPDDVQDSWLVQAIFDPASEGNSEIGVLYDYAESDVLAYSTLDPSAIAFDVPSGEDSSVDLSGHFSFNASVTFGNVLSDGTLYASECTANESFRYISPELVCLRLSSAVEMDPGSTALVNVSFAGKTPPTGHSDDEADLFHFDVAQDTVFDITEARNTSVTHTVTGETTTFGRFIVAVPQHPEKPEGSVRQQVYVGSNANSVLSFRNIDDPTNSSDTATYSFDKSSYDIGDIVTLTITDSNGNIDPSTVDIVKAAVESDTSREINDYILLTLRETGANTGVFSGSFTLSSATTSSDSGLLKASTGDSLSGFYISGVRFRAEVSNPVESGLLEMKDTVVDPSACFVPIGGAVDLELADLDMLQGQASIHVTLSYANARLQGYQPSDLTIFHKIDAGWLNMNEIATVTLDESSSTLSTDTNSLGAFSIGFDGGCGGGSGGGLARPGTGLVLDFAAPLVKKTTSSGSSGGGGGGGGGGSTSEVTLQQTHNAAYFEENPLAKFSTEAVAIVAADGASSDSGPVHSGEQVTIQSTISNRQSGVPQPYAWIVQVVDKNGITVSLEMQEGSLDPGQSATLSILWTAEGEPGMYTIHMFTWNTIGDNPSPLSELHVRSLQVQGT